MNNIQSTDHQHKLILKLEIRFHRYTQSKFNDNHKYTMVTIETPEF